MFLKKERVQLKLIRIVVISLTIFFLTGTVGYCVSGYMGLIYMKYGEGKRVFEFIEDMNMDGIKENVKFVNHYYLYNKKNTCDAEYTSNNIRIFIDDKEIYSNGISTLSPLLNPKIVDLEEKNTKKKQIYVHSDGGGSAIPMDYFFSYEEGKVMLSELESRFNN